MYKGSWEQVIFKTCHQEIALYYRKNKHNQLTEKLDGILDNADADIVFEKQKEELLSLLESSILLIAPPIRQTIFRMNKLQGIRQVQIAMQLKMSKRTVENHIHKAMNFLKSLHKNS